MCQGAPQPHLPPSERPRLGHQPAFGRDYQQRSEGEDVGEREDSRGAGRRREPPLQELAAGGAWWLRDGEALVAKLDPLTVSWRVRLWEVLSLAEGRGARWLTHLFFGPLADLPYLERQQAVAAVRAGRPLARSTDVPLAAGYARRVLRLYKLAMVIGVVAVVVGVVQFISGPSSRELYAVPFLFFVPLCARESQRARRFLHS